VLWIRPQQRSLILDFLKNLIGTDTLAYFGATSVTKKKSLPTFWSASTRANFVRSTTSSTTAAASPMMKDTHRLSAASSTGRTQEGPDIRATTLTPLPRTVQCTLTTTTTTGQGWTPMQTEWRAWVRTTLPGCWAGAQEVAARAAPAAQVVWPAGTATMFTEGRALVSPSPALTCWWTLTTISLLLTRCQCYKNLSSLPLALQLVCFPLACFLRPTWPYPCPTHSVSIYPWTSLKTLPGINTLAYFDEVKGFITLTSEEIPVSTKSPDGPGSRQIRKGEKAFNHRHLRKIGWLMAHTLPALFVLLVLLVATAKMPFEEAALVVDT